MINLMGSLIHKSRRCPRYHGWYYWYLRSCGFGLDLGWPEAEVTLIHWIYPTWRRAQCWFGRSCCWVNIPIPLSLSPPLSSKPGALLIRKNRFAIGIVGDAGVRGSAQQPRLFVGMILILIFAEVLGTLGSHRRICWQANEVI